MTPREAGAEVAEYVLGLDALGLGAKANGIRLRALLDVRAVLMRQSLLLGQSLRLGRSVVPGAVSRSGLDEARAEKLAREASAMDAELVEVWGRCLEQLRIFYLTSEAA